MQYSYCVLPAVFLLQKKFEGTRVTIETFLAWKEKFDAELSESSRLRGDVKDKKDAKKLTGSLNTIIGVALFKNLLCVSLYILPLHYLAFLSVFVMCSSGTD